MVEDECLTLIDWYVRPSAPAVVATGTNSHQPPGYHQCALPSSELDMWASFSSDGRTIYDPLIAARQGFQIYGVGRGTFSFPRPNVWGCNETRVRRAVLEKLPRSRGSQGAPSTRRRTTPRRREEMATCGPERNPYQREQHREGIQPFRRSFPFIERDACGKAKACKPTRHRRAGQVRPLTPSSLPACGK